VVGRAQFDNLRLGRRLPGERAVWMLVGPRVSMGIEGYS
jgi:hypothetical protein